MNNQLNDTNTQTEVKLDYLIIGAGPAGLQLGYFLEKENRNYLILEAAKGAGAFFEKHPRHRTLLSINKRFTGYEDRESRLRYDWNSLLCDDPELDFRNYSKEYYPDAGDLVRYLRDFGERNNLKIRTEARAVRISKENDEFIVKDIQDRTYRARALVIAAGTPRPWLPEIPGIELGENYDSMSVNADDYDDQRVLIIGKSNSAFETGNHLLGAARMIHICSPTPTKQAFATHYVGNLRSVNAEFLDTYLLKGQNTILDADIEKIQKVDGEFLVRVNYKHAQGQSMDLAYDRILVCTGFRFDDSAFDENCRPRLTFRDKLPDLTSEWESTSVKNLFFAGSLMQARDYRKTQSNVIHGFRFNVRTLDRILTNRFHDIDLHSKELTPSPGVLAGELIKRAGQSPGLFQQPGYLCDVAIVRGGDKPVRYLHEFPIDYVREKLSGEEHFYTLTLEYGDKPADPLHYDRNPDPERAYQESILHPIVRRYMGSNLVAIHHIPESMETDWLNFQCVRAISDQEIHSVTENIRKRLSMFLLSFFSWTASANEAALDKSEIEEAV